MNSNKILFLVVLLAGIVLSACSDDDATTTEKAPEQAGASKGEKKILYWVAPMDPAYRRDGPGKSPMGMDLVPVYDETEKSPEQAGVSKGEKKILYWVAPMDPAYRRDGPGKSPMGMDLVPVYDEGDGSAVKISPAVENNMGVRTAVVKRNNLGRRIDTVGYVDFDEKKISHVHIRTNGWIEKLLVQSEGERVKKGQLLFELYSPELVNAQDDYIQALKSGSRFLLVASRERLLALGISRQQVNEITKQRRSSQFVRVYAPQDGIVAQLKVREGMYITPKMEVMSLADLSTIWLLAEVFESQANWVKQGQPAEVKLSYVPGRVWQGKVEYIYPSLNEQTRTLKVRLVFENPDEALKPNMFASVTINGGPKQDVLIIPREALIRTGGDSRVILKVAKGRFETREVVAGIESGDWIEIRKGLLAGDTVVTSGQFLIDSEASLKASLQRMQSPAADKTAPMDKQTTSEMAENNKPQAMEEMDQSQPPALDKKITAKGLVREVRVDEDKVKLSHDPIAALDWPAMTMSFQVDPAVELDSFKPGDKVEFDLQKADRGYVIKAMRKSAK